MSKDLLSSVPACTGSEVVEDDDRSFKKVILSGCTGFVGSFILLEILRQLPQTTTIVCLVRAKTIDAGWKRLESTLGLYELVDRADKFEWRTRLEV